MHLQSHPIRSKHNNTAPNTYNSFIHNNTPPATSTTHLQLQAQHSSSYKHNTPPATSTTLLQYIHNNITLRLPNISHLQYRLRSHPGRQRLSHCTGTAHSPLSLPRGSTQPHRPRKKDPHRGRGTDTPPTNGIKRVGYANIHVNMH